MRNLRDLAVRSHTCLNCHVGTEEKSVDHQMIAAGHPDLTFELNLFSAVMPRHWNESDEVAWFGTKEWAVGQGMQLCDSLQTSCATSAQFNVAGIFRTGLLRLPPQSDCS